MIHRFHLFTHFFNLLKASFHRPFFTDLNVVWRHQSGNGIGIIAQKFQGNSSFLRIKVINGIFNEFVRKILEKRGWTLLRAQGSHHIYGKSGNEVRLSVPIHKNQI